MTTHTETADQPNKPPGVRVVQTDGPTLTYHTATRLEYSPEDGSVTVYDGEDTVAVFTRGTFKWAERYG